jgi:hypothetical protein
MKSFFLSGKGLRQGDSLSPLLFDQVVDTLTIILAKTAKAGLIRGLCSDVCPGGVILLQYEDDTILFVDDDVSLASNLKYVLTCFEQASGVQINYNKSELIPLGMEDHEIEAFTQVFCCSRGKFPIKYSGVPLHFKKLKRDDLQPLINKTLQKIACLRGKLFSYRARVLLVKTCLASIHVYLLSFFKFPKWALELINS